MLLMNWVAEGVCDILVNSGWEDDGAYELSMGTELFGTNDDGEGEFGKL